MCASERRPVSPPADWLSQCFYAQAQDHNKGPSKAKNDGRNGAATAKNVGVQHRVTTRSAIMTRQVSLSLLLYDGNFETCWGEILIPILSFMRLVSQKRKAAAQPIPCYFRSAKARKPQETSKE